MQCKEVYTKGPVFIQKGLIYFKEDIYYSYYGTQQILSFMVTVLSMIINQTDKQVFVQVHFAHIFAWCACDVHVIKDFRDLIGPNSIF